MGRHFARSFGGVMGALFCVAHVPLPEQYALLTLVAYVIAGASIASMAYKLARLSCEG